MKKYRRIFTIVIDSLGIGAAKDADSYGDAGTDTLGHISENVENLRIPNLQKLGIANLHPLKHVKPADQPLAYYMAMQEASVGKDTMNGHWEMMGLHITTPFKTFTEHGFPKELLEELAEEEINTGHMIVYTSADSVLQICGNEDTFGLDELYRC